jgi:integrase
VCDFCLLAVLLQTGVRISELCALTVDDIDLTHELLTVRAGKGMKARTIPLEKKASSALTGWLKIRPGSYHQALFPSLSSSRAEQPY